MGESFGRCMTSPRNTASLHLLQEIIGSRRRSLSLLVDRDSDFARHWGVPIHRAFYSALDIRPTNYVERQPDGGRKTIQQITQGCNFSFADRDIIYDSSTAYSDVWSQCLLHFRYRIQIDKATNAGIEEAGTVDYFIEENVTKAVGPMPVIGHFTCSQHEFVRRLIVGMDAMLEVQ